MTRRWCFFAINNVCNNKCEMCGIWKQKPKIVRFDDAKRVIDKLSENNFNVLQLTGGEPLMNPDFFDIAKYAKDRKLLVFIPTNGTLIDEEMAEKLKRSKIDQVSVSLHHCDPDIFDKISGRKDILATVVNSIKILQKKKVPVSVLCTITKDNANDIEKIVKFVNKMDTAISFCLPVSVKNTSFKLGGEAAEISKDEMRKALFRIIKMKKHGYNVLNTLEFLMDMVRYLDGENKYSCLGGERLIYIDWNLDVFPCMFTGKPTKLDRYDFGKARNKRCNKCMIQCFREPSMLMQKETETTKIMIKELPFMSVTAFKGMKTILKSS